MNQTHKKDFYRIKCFALILLIAISGCHNTAEFIATAELVKNDQIVAIPIPTTINCQSQSIQYLDNEKVLAYSSNNQIYFFCLDSLRLIKTTNYQQNGPDGVHRFSGFHVLNMDTVILTSQISIILADTEDRIYNKLDLLEWNSQFTKPYIIFPPSRMSDFHLVRINNCLYFSCFNFDLDGSDFGKTSIGIIYDLDRNQIQEMNFNYPSFPKAYSSLEHKVSRVFKDNKWVYSFAMLDDAFVFEPNGNYQRHCIKSVNYSNNVRINRIAEKDFSVIAAVNTPSYITFKYDPWRDVFYRFFYPGYDAEPNKDDNYYFELSSTPPVFSVIIIDSNFEVIGETIMPFQHYDPYSNYISEDGLFFGLHVKHPDFDPDYLKFARFNIEPIQR